MRLIAQNSHSYTDIQNSFRWKIPASFNIAAAVCDRHVSKADRVALYWEHQDGRKSQYTFGDIRKMANQFANVLKARGISRGDRVAIVLPQRIETAVAHLAAFKIGAISVPLSVLFGGDAIHYRLQDSGATAVVCGDQHFELLHNLQEELDDLKTIISCDGMGSEAFWPLLDRADDECETLKTSPDDPAIIIYTSGTTGSPKGALIAHRCLLGNLTGFELSQEFFPQTDDLFWTPADWAWTGGLIDALLPSWYYGIPVLGYESGRFDAEKVCQLIGRYGVRNAFIPPTALKMMRQVPNLRERYNLRFRSIMSAGESMGAELYHWGVEVLGLEINEMWAQSEFNYIVGNCASRMPVKPGSMGKAYPGHRVAPINDHGEEVPDGEVGELAAWRNDPVMFLGYWNRQQATKDKFIGSWWGTGDVGYRDDDGYLWFVGR
ncbi:MAG: acetyl-CoA synthetase, partial [Parasphingorhabdus sp.]